MSAKWPSTILAILVWFLLGIFDFWSGFVGVSPLRLILLSILAVALLPFELPSVLNHQLSRLREQKVLHYVLLLILVGLGYVIFLSRYLRGGNMADDFIFEKVIQNTAAGCFFCYSAPGGVYFGNHNNLFLISFVPFTLFSNWWLIPHLVQSTAIVLWCRVCGWGLGRDTNSGWLVTIGLFFATYTQHASFYDTRFAALALAVFALGFYLNKTRLMWAGALTALITRETTGLTLMMFGAQGVRTAAKKTLMAIGFAGLLWFTASYFLMSAAGRAPALMRFNSCFSPSQSLPDASCVLASLSTDWELKLAYTLRLIRYAPSLSAFPSLIAVLPDLGLTWFSQDNVLYNLSWHYYMQTLGVLIVGAGIGLRGRFAFKYSENLPIRWIAASSLWQFVTLVRPNLF